mgnify:CR=1 FL=1
MENRPKVTLLAPCYNAAPFIGRFLDSVLKQSYRDICFILINDGSSDETESIISGYSSRLKNYLSEFIYLKKENNGAASAIDYALKYVDSEYLAWADVDDVLHPDNILLKKNYLDAHDEVGLVLCGANAIDEKTKERIRLLTIKPEERKDNIFDRLIFKGIPCYPGVFMIRKKLLFNRLNDKNIYWEKEVGQNWQLLLPVAYDNSCGYINEILYDYYIRADSHSHNTDYEREIFRTYAQERVLRNTLYFLPDDEKRNLFDRITTKYMIKRMELSIREKKFRKYIIYLKEWQAYKNLSTVIIMIKSLTMIGMLMRSMFFRILKRVK